MRLNNLAVSSKIDVDQEKIVIEKLFEHKKRQIKSFTFDELKKLLSDDEILCIVNWYKSHIDSLVEFSKKVTTGALSKRKVQSILEEL